jgi:hypothetical protein
MSQSGPQPGVSDNGTIIIATLTCPDCGFNQDVDMLENASVQFHTCVQCQARIKAKSGTCCVFCSYADIPCPTAQISAKSCCYDD